jgi:putative ABC transport system ATP-binding protein/lipoprotein-releasing system ATP-binding protein
MTRPLVEAESVSRRFGEGEPSLEALRPVSFRIETGDQIAVLGPSGSGKSTLLNLIGGLDEPTTGRIAWPGIGERHMLRPLAIGMIHQFASLIPTLSVTENVALPLRLGHIDNTGEEVADAIDRLGLTSYADRLPGELSGGQAQRATIARAIAHRPKLLIADEPTGQLDQITAQGVLDVILSRASKSGLAILIATHDQKVAARMRTIWQLEHGEICFQ